MLDHLLNLASHIWWHSACQGHAAAGSCGYQGGINYLMSAEGGQDWACYTEGRCAIPPRCKLEPKLVKRGLIMSTKKGKNMKKYEK